MEQTSLEAGSGIVVEHLQRRRPALPALAHEEGIMKGSGTLLNQLKIMIRIQLSLIVPKDPGVCGQPLASGKEVDPVKVHLDRGL